MPNKPGVDARCRVLRTGLFAEGVPVSSRARPQGGLEKRCRRGMLRLLRHHNLALRYGTTSMNSGEVSRSPKPWVFSNGPDYYSNHATNSMRQPHRSELKRDDNPQPRKVDATLGETDVEGSISRLSRALADDDEDTRLYAVRALSDMGGDSALRVLRATLEEEDHATLKTANSTLSGLSDTDP